MEFRFGWTVEKEMKVKEVMMQKNEPSCMIETAHDLNISALCVNNFDKHIVYTGSRDYI